VSGLVVHASKNMTVKLDKFGKFIDGNQADDYNRFETARHKEAMRNERQKSEECRFQAFGDRPGSGVEMTSHHWQGGE
ncbi:hypothetical protein ANCDUO_26623, partial [Ancylostoma duodenale]